MLIGHLHLLSAEGQTGPKLRCWGHVLQIRLVILNGLAQWYNSTEGKSNLIGYTVLSDIIAYSVGLPQLLR